MNQRVFKCTVVLMALCLAAFCYEQFTLIGKADFDVRSLGLKQNTFPVDYKLDGINHVRACESIDNSMVVVIADQVPAATLEEWFGNAGVRNSLTELLRRGGVLYFGWNSWTNLNHPLPQTRGFYKSCGIPFPHIGILAEFDHPTIKDFPKYGSPNAKCDAAFLRVPNDYTKGNGKGKFQMAATRWYKGWNIPGLEVLFASPEGEPVMLAMRKVLGKGVAIYSTTFSPMRSKESPFIENLVRYAYGEREKVSEADIAAKEVAALLNKDASGSKGKAIAVPPILMLTENEADAKTLVFKNHHEKKPVQLASEAKVFGNAEKITVHVKCMRPDADKVKNKIPKGRDNTVWYDDAVNVMFAADIKEPPNHSFIINSDGAVYDARGQNPLWNGNFTLETKRSGAFWEVIFSIAPSELGVDLKKDKYLLFNVGREGTPTNEVTSVYPGYNDPTKYSILGIAKESELSELYTVKRQPPKLDTPYLVWTDSPMRKYFTNTLPEKPVDNTNIDITIARNEKESAVFCITNVTDKNVVFRLEPDMQLKGTQISFKDMITIKEVMPRLNNLGQPQFEAIGALNETGCVSVPAFETKVIWLDFRTMLAAGKYEWNIEVVPTTLADAVCKKVHVNIEVLKYTFPDKLKADAWGFGPYIYSYAEGKREEYYSFWREYHHNYICHWRGIAENAIKFDKATNKIIISDNFADYDLEEEYLLANGWKWFYSYGSYWPFKEALAKHGKKLTIFDAEFKELFGKYLRNWAASLRKRNIPFDHFYVEVGDEPSPEVYDEYVECGNFIKKTIPEFQMFGTIPTWIDQPALERFKAFIDLWIPWEPRLTERANKDAELKFYHTYGKKFLPYLCGVSLPLMDLQTYFRFRGIRTFLLDNDGFALWGFNSWVKNSYYGTLDKGQWDGFCFYHGNDGPIPTPRMEAFREAVEDLHLLLEAKEILKTRNDAKLAELTSKDYLNKVLADASLVKTYEWRTALLRRISEMK